MKRHIPKGIQIALSDPHANIDKSRHVAFLFPRGQKRKPLNIGVNSFTKGMTADNFISCHAEANAVLYGPHRHTYMGDHKKAKAALPQYRVQQRQRLLSLEEKRQWEKEVY